MTNTPFHGISFVDIILDRATMDAREPPDLPQKKGGFKGKWTTQKFACNLKKGTDQKDSTTRHQYVDALSVSMNMSPSPSDPYITSMAIVPSKVARRMG
jgi:hypothetical protein